MSNSFQKRQAADKHNYERWLEQNARYEVQRPQRKKRRVSQSVKPSAFGTKSAVMLAAAMSIGYHRGL